MKKLLFISLFLPFLPSFAQELELDSLQKFVATAKDDTTLIIGLNRLTQLMTTQGDLKEASVHGKKALELSTKLKYQNGLANAYNNTGVIFLNQGNYPEALKAHNQALEIRLKRGIKADIAASYNNIGNTNFLLNNFTDALKYYTLALKLKKEAGTKKSLINAYNNIGNVYLQTNDLEKSLAYYDSSLTVSKEFKNKNGVSNSTNNIALIYERQGKLAEAFKLYKEVEKIALENKEKAALAVANVNLSAVLLKLKRLPEAKRSAETALNVSKEMGNREYMKEAFLNLSLIDSAMGNERGQLENFKMFVLYADSLSNEENTRKATAQEIQYGFSKKAAADSIKNLEKVRLEELKHSKEIRQQNMYTYGGIIGFLLMLMLAGISFRAFNQKKKANVLIEEQKMMVEEKQKEIMDSIHYAKRIQSSLLPTDKYFERNLKRLNK